MRQSANQRVLPMRQHNSPSQGASAAIEHAGPADVGEIAAQLLRFACRSNEPTEYLSAALPVVEAGMAVDCAAVVWASGGRWSVLAATAPTGALPIELLADVLDSRTARSAAQWAALPMSQDPTDSEILLLRYGREGAPAVVRSVGQRMDAAERLARTVFEGLAAVRTRQQANSRLKRLETILEIASGWHRTREVEPLLVKMAEAATRLLGADRASIFVWDRANRILVGRPALGVKDGELRIPDSCGVVGQVIQTGAARRVDASLEPDQIDHRVDAQLKYQTRTVLCVPLRGRSGELFGAFEVINKRDGAFTQADEDALVELAAHAAVALENAQDRQQLIRASQQIVQQAAEAVRLIGESPAIQALRSTIRRVADTDLAVLITGENGTGKEVVAQSIHYLSPRRDKPFVAVNCAAIPDTLAESELFGHEKGAFTDAKQARAGKFELASGGTLFLDEVGELSLSGQSKLLRVLEEKVLVRVGGSVPIHTDVRILAATNQNLAEMVRNKRFREDLYYRLNVVTIELPPLRQRGEDVLLLAEYFLSDFCRKARRKVPQLTPAARKRLTDHHWPGNVRELRNLMERLAYLGSEEWIDADELNFILAPRGAAPPALEVNMPLTEATLEFQRQYIARAIKQSDGCMKRAAELLGLHRSNLYRKMRQLGMECKDTECKDS